MFDDRKPLVTFLIGTSMGIFMVMIAIAATAGGESPGAQMTMGEINLGSGIVAGILLVLGVVLAMPIIKEDDDAKKEIMLLLLITMVFIIAFAIVSAL